MRLKMKWLKFAMLLVLIIFVFVAKGRRSNERRSKFLSFNTLDGDVSVNLEFSIPFITVPVKKTMEGFGSTVLGLPTVNVNLAALALGGIVVFGTVLLIPLLLKTFATLHPYKQYSRFVDNAEFGAVHVLDFGKHLMMDSRTLQGCTLRLACWSAQRSSGNDARNLLNKVSGNNILSTFVNATALEEAMSSGRNGRDCLTYGPCTLREEYIPVLFNSISTFGKRRNDYNP